MIPNARLGYPKLFKAEGIQGDPSSKPRFGCQILLPKTDTKTKARLDAAKGNENDQKFEDLAEQERLRKEREAYDKQRNGGGDKK